MWTPVSRFHAFLGSGVFLCVVAACANAQGAENDKIDRGLRESLRVGAATQHVIISTKPGYRETARKALTDHGDLVKTDHPGIGALSAEIHSGDVGELARQPWVNSVSLDAIVNAVGDKHKVRDTGGPSFGPGTKNLVSSVNPLREAVGLSSVTAASRGSGIVVAVIDSGLAISDDLSRERVLAFYDYTGTRCPAPCETEPFDDFGHGTHVAGLVGSSGKLSGSRFQGIAPDVDFVGVKVLDAGGAGKTSDVISAIEFLVTHSELHVRVINLSIGHPILAPGRLDPLVRAVEYASAAGIIVVVAAGNDGQVCETDVDGTQACSGPFYATIDSPGNAPSAITVGAVDTNGSASRGDDAVTSYSSRGPSWFDAVPKPDVVAPGHHLWSDATGVLQSATTLWQKCLDVEQARGTVFCHEGDFNSPQFLRLSGTSMSTAVATGVVALVLKANASLTPNIVKAILEYTAIPLANVDVLTQGTGGINAGGALALASAINADVPLGNWWLGAGLEPSTRIGESTSAWSQSVLWGQNILGGDLVYRHLLIWSQQVAWGTNLIRLRVAKPSDVSGLSRTHDVVWGPNTTIRAADIVWRGNAIWGANDNIIWGTDHVVWVTQLAPGRVLGLTDGDNIIWGTGEGDNIIWGTHKVGDIVWGVYDGDNIIWGTNDGDNIIWGTTPGDGDNIIWGTLDGDNIIWGTSDGDNIIWGTTPTDGDNIIWGTSLSDGDNIIWGT
jgi:serine protease AprX